MKKELFAYVQETSSRVSQAFSAQKGICVLVDLLIQSNSDESLKDEAFKHSVQLYLRKRILEHTEDFIELSCSNLEEIKSFHALHRHLSVKKSDNKCMIETLGSNLYLLNHLCKQGKGIEREFNEASSPHLAARRVTRYLED